MSIFRFPLSGVRTFSQALVARSAAPYPRINQLLSITKTLQRVVRLTGIIILIGCLNASARTNAQERITINMKSARLDKIFSEIELRSGYTVFYNTEVLKYAGDPISIEVKDATISDVMHQVLKGLPLEFNIQDKTIFVKHVTHTAAVETAGPGKNGGTPEAVSGVVQSETGTPLAGATVYIRKLKKTAVSDGKGEVMLKDVPDGEYEVEISYVGFESLRTKITVVNHEAVFTAALKQMMSKLDETVVKGYYTTTNRLNTGDVTTVKGEDIQKQPVSDPLLALEGRVAGLSIQQTSGIPGAYSTLTIRGINSMANGNDPLYVVDGVPFSSLSLSEAVGGGAVGNSPGVISNVTGANRGGQGMSPFNSLNPADIETVEVLKDADATAIYGSRGANGVILITTKKGKAGKTHFDLNVFSGGGTVTRMMSLLNTKQYLEMRDEAFTQDGLPVPSIITDPNDYNYDVDGVWDTTRYTNWQKVLIGNTAGFTNAQGNLSGGNATTQFVIGAGYSRQGTVYPGNSIDQKASGHLTLTHASENGRLHLNFTTSYVLDNSNLPQADLTSSIITEPDAPAPYDAYGNLNWQMLNGSYTFNNPLAITLNKNKANTDNLVSNLNLGYQVLPGLEIKSTFGYNHEQMNQFDIAPGASQPPPYNTMPTSRQLTYGTTDFKTWIIEPQVNFRRKIRAGQLEALVGSTFEADVHNSVGQEAYGFPSDALISDPLAATTKTIDNYSNTVYHYSAIYGRLSYNWDEKYLMNLTARRDGSSRFGPGKQFGNFGAVGVGWIFSRERFIQDNFSFLSFGKMRGSYGTTGNDQITNYQFLSTYTPLAPTYQGVAGLLPTRLTNPFFAWEVVKKLEGGLELGFLRDRILVSASYYRNRTGNQLVGLSLPALTGFTSVQFNLPAVVQNSGTEYSLYSVNIKTNNFAWTSNINLTIPKNKLVSFPNIADFPSYANSYVVGQSLFIEKSYRLTGVDPQTGIYTFFTKNAGGQPSYPQDLYPTKPVTQKYYGGFENSFAFKGFRLDILVQYVNQLSYNYKLSFGPPGSDGNQPTAVLGRWQSPGDLTGIQRFGTSNLTSDAYYSYLQLSDGIISDGSFLRLKNVALSYEMPPSWAGKLHFQNARIYLQCQNLLTITSYLGLDPETGGLSLPPLKMITAGIQVGL